MTEFAKAQLEMTPEEEFLMVSTYSMGINAAVKAIIGTDDEKLYKATLELVVPMVISIAKQEKTALSGYDGSNTEDMAMNLLEQKCGRAWLIQMAKVLDSMISQNK